MSLESWKEEFYPITGGQATRGGDDKVMLKHSLKKWQGLSPENLQKHGLEIGHSLGSYIVEPLNRYKYMSIDCFSCALCVEYKEDDCIDCPLYLYSETQSRCRGPSWDDWKIKRNPDKVIKDLEQALHFVETNHSNLETSSEKF